MPTGIYKRKSFIKKCHLNVKRHIQGICINCYSKKLKEKNPQYKINQQNSTKKRYKKYGSKILNKSRTPKAREYRIQAIINLGGICTRCGYSDIRALHIDHINGDGKDERGIRKTIHKNIAKKIIDISRYQLLCANCNWIKRIENNEGTNREDFNNYMLKMNEKIKNK